MTRTEAIAQINATLEQLTDERLQTMAELAKAWTRPTIYSTRTEAEKGQIDAALDELDRGEGIPGEQVFTELRQRIAAAKAGG